MKLVALILAGGKGERLWPLSQPEKPKQFLTLTQSKLSLLQLTIQRIEAMVKMRNIFVITGDPFVHLVEEQVPDLSKDHIIVEPCGRNTAPAIALSLFVIKRLYPNEEVTVMVFPSDHLIEPEDAFIQTMDEATKSAMGGAIVTIGVKPTYPETGYGYIKASANGAAACTVERFVEKPDKETATRYLESGKFFWNAGIFVFNLSVMEKELETYVPDIFHQIQVMASGGKPDKSAYAKLPSISIDYAVMEKSHVVKMAPAQFSWDDVGSFLAFTRHHQQDEAGNTLVSENTQVMLSLSHNNIIDIQDSQTKQVILVGIDACTIIENEGTLLICANSHVQEIQKLIKQSKGPMS